VSDARIPVSMSLFRTAGISHQGRRATNQDAYTVLTFPSRKGELLSAAFVADGIGGQAAGSVASNLAVDACKQYIDALPSVSYRQASEVLTDVFARANRSLLEAVRKDQAISGMGTTLVAMLVFEDRVVVAHLGDSKCFRFGGDGFAQVTQDHSAVEDALRRRVYTEEEVLQTKQIMDLSSALVKNLGTDPCDEPDIVELPFDEDSAFLLCTDGLVGTRLTPLLTNFEIDKLLRESKTPQQAVNDLAVTAYANGSSDNITAVLLCGRAFPFTGFRRPYRPIEKAVSGQGGERTTVAFSKLKVILAAVTAILLILLVIKVVPRKSPTPGGGGSGETIATDTMGSTQKSITKIIPPLPFGHRQGSVTIEITGDIVNLNGGIEFDISNYQEKSNHVFMKLDKSEVKRDSIKVLDGHVSVEAGYLKSLSRKGTIGMLIIEVRNNADSCLTQRKIPYKYPGGN